MEDGVLFALLLIKPRYPSLRSTAEIFLKQKEIKKVSGQRFIIEPNKSSQAFNGGSKTAASNRTVPYQSSCISVSDTSC